MDEEQQQKKHIDLGDGVSIETDGPDKVDAQEKNVDTQTFEEELTKQEKEAQQAADTLEDDLKDEPEDIDPYEVNMNLDTAPRDLHALELGEVRAVPTSGIPKKTVSQGEAVKPPAGAGNLGDLRQRVLQESTMQAHDERAPEVKGFGTPQLVQEPPTPEERLQEGRGNTVVQLQTPMQPTSQSPQDTVEIVQPEMTQNPKQKPSVVQRLKQALVPGKDVQTLQASFESQQQEVLAPKTPVQKTPELEQIKTQPGIQPVQEKTLQPETAPTIPNTQDSVWQKKVSEAEAEDSALTGRVVAQEEQLAKQPKALSPEELRKDLVRRAKSGETYVPTQEDEPQDVHLRAVRTYEGDIAGAVKHRKASLVHILASEEDSRVQERIRVEQSGSAPAQLKREASGYVFVMFAGLFVGIGLAAVVFALVSMKGNVPSVVPLQAIPEFIFTEDVEQLDITGLERRDMMAKLSQVTRESEIPLGGINNVVVTQTEVDSSGNSRIRLAHAEEFFRALDTRAPDALLRSLQDTLMVGVHAFGEFEPFMILQTTFFDNTFAGLLSWEKDMNTDLAPWFGEIINAQTGELATSTADLLRIGIFEDLVIANKEVRVLRNRGGEIVLLYGFPDARTVVITTNENTFAEIVTRLTSRRF